VQWWGGLSVCARFQPVPSGAGLNAPRRLKACPTTRAATLALFIIGGEPSAGHGAIGAGEGAPRAGSADYRDYENGLAPWERRMLPTAWATMERPAVCGLSGREDWDAAHSADDAQPEHGCCRGAGDSEGYLWRGVLRARVASGFGSICLCKFPKRGGRGGSDTIKERDAGRCLGTVYRARTHRKRAGLAPRPLFVLQTGLSLVADLFVLAVLSATSERRVGPGAL
jgi:hypothetical protein